MSHILRRFMPSLRYPLTLLLGLVGMALPGYSLCSFYCTTSGLMTLDPGCSDWPEVLRGALYMVPFLLVLPWRPAHALFAVVPVVLMSAFGGLYEMAMGSYLSIDSMGDLFAWLQHSYAVLLGAACASLIWFASSRRIMRFWAALAEP
ncbi:hypothetical protein [Aquimonas sp.]|jgi:hypothetical protein|uniref:hypothetical protein n=1 Tax=Aquimonas sp. TaxID=1872588 RepID=UPI0037C02976